jgi:hypothetical protein
MKPDTLRQAPPARKLLIALATIPSIDCVLDQINNALKPAEGSLSILQLVRAVQLVVFFIVIARELARDRSSLARIPIPAVGAFLVLGLAASKELVVSGRISMNSIGAYGQLLYWVVLWAMVCLLCRLPEQRDILLRGLAWGACLIAASVFLGLYFGSTNYYKDDLVESSAGWFDTAKMITGPLVVGGIVILYLGRNKRSWWPCAGAAFCFAACVVTYARAGSIALVAVLLWLALWRVLFARRAAGRWLNRFLIAGACACVLVPIAIDSSVLLARWSDTGGSGRATFWRVALDTYNGEALPAQAMGIGYNSMSEMLFRNYGDDIKHTHNDMLDVLLVSGLAGALWLIGLLVSFARNALRSPFRSPQGAAAIAIVICYLCHSMLTGQIWGTDAMTYYVLGLTCLIREIDGSHSTLPARAGLLGQRELFA